MKGTVVIMFLMYSRGMHISLPGLEVRGKLQASLTISSNSCWRVREVTNLKGFWILRETAWWEGTLFSITEHTLPSNRVTHMLHSRPHPHFHCHAPALKLRRSNPRNLFPYDWLLCYPQRGRGKGGGERENMGWERRFNMTKPVPGDPVFSPP